MASGVQPQALKAALQSVLEGQQFLEELLSLDGLSGACTPVPQGDSEDEEELDTWCTCGLPSSSSIASSCSVVSEEAGEGAVAGAATCPVHRASACSSQRFDSWEELEEMCETLDGCRSGRVVEIDLTHLLEYGPHYACAPEVTFDTCVPWPSPADT